MAITTKFVTGFETGVLTANGSNGTPSRDNDGGFSTVNAGCAISTTTSRSGARHLRITKPITTASRVTRTIVANARVNIGFAFRFVDISNLAPGLAATLMEYNATNPGGIYIYDTGEIELWAGPTATPTKSTLSYDDGLWHYVSMQVDMTANPWTVRWEIDGIAEADSTDARAASTVSTVIFGSIYTTEAADTKDFDDIIIGTSDSASDLYDEVKVLFETVESDGTHSTPGSFSPGDGGAAYGATTIAYQMVDEAPAWSTTRSTTDNNAQRTANAAHYLEFAAPPVENLRPDDAVAVQATMLYSSSGTTANTAGTVVRTSAGADVEIYGSGTTARDYSESSNFHKGLAVTKPAAGWTPAEIAAIRVRFGYATDVSPIPTIQAVGFEIAYRGSGPLVHQSRRAGRARAPTPASFGG